MSVKLLLWTRVCSVLACHVGRYQNFCQFTRSWCGLNFERREEWHVCTSLSFSQTLTVHPALIRAASGNAREFQKNVQKSSTGIFFGCGGGGKGDKIATILWPTKTSSFGTSFISNRKSVTVFCTHSNPRTFICKHDTLRRRERFATCTWASNVVFQVFRLVCSSFVFAVVIILHRTGCCW